MYRVQLHDSECGTINFGAGSGGEKHCLAWQRRNQPMPVAIALGGDPALIWAAGAPLPKGSDELRMAAWTSGRAQAITRCLSQPLQIPADAESVIEGVILPGETRAEGLFGNHTGGYVSNPAATLFLVLNLNRRAKRAQPNRAIAYSNQELLSLKTTQTHPSRIPGDVPQATTLERNP